MFFSQIDRGTDGHGGAVLDEQGAIRWRYGTRKKPSGRRLGNPFNKPDFVIADPDGRGEVVICRTSFIPPVFNIMEAGRIIGRVKMCSVFRNKYAIDIDPVNSWTFRMPLFTIRFFGDSRSGPEIWVAVWAFQNGMEGSYQTRHPRMASSSCPGVHSCRGVELRLISRLVPAQAFLHSLIGCEAG